MTIDEKNIRRFLAGACSPSEARVISDYLKQHPEILDSYFSEKEWLEMLQQVPGESVPYKEKLLFENIKHRVWGQRMYVVKWRPLAPWLAAASILGVVLFTWIYTRQHGENKPVMAISAKVPQGLPDSIVWTNYSAHKERRYLSDGSVIDLNPGSVLRYRKDFAKNCRLLNLKGTAKFMVAKDAGRPFTVTAGTISTTALGTVFYVYGPDNKVSVKLLRGKVLVQNIKRPLEKVYLSPGESCNFNGLQLEKVIPSPGETVPTAKTIPSSRHEKNDGTPDYSFMDGNNRIQLKNANLPVTFNVLERLYKININYSDLPPSVIKRSLYSGIVDRDKMSSEKAIKIVADVCDLVVQKTDSVNYRILPKY